MNFLQPCHKLACLKNSYYKYIYIYFFLNILMPLLLGMVLAYKLFILAELKSTSIEFNPQAVSEASDKLNTYFLRLRSLEEKNKTLGKGAIGNISVMIKILDNVPKGMTLTSFVFNKEGFTMTVQYENFDVVGDFLKNLKGVLKAFEFNEYQELQNKSKEHVCTISACLKNIKSDKMD